MSISPWATSVLLVVPSLSVHVDREELGKTDARRHNFFGSFFAFSASCGLRLRFVFAIAISNVNRWLLLLCSHI